MQIKIYQTENAKRPFSQRLKDLKDCVARATIRTRLDRLELGNFGKCKPVFKDYQFRGDHDE